MFSTEKDNDLKKIPHLTWLPWIGSEYFNNRRRLLIVGESHYADGESIVAYQDNLSLLSKNDFTRNTVLQTQLQRLYPHKTLDNFFKAFFGNGAVNPKKLWKEIAFYNLIQRVMDYSSFDSKRTEQPKIEDFETGWKVFVEIVKILKPTDCVFMGVSAATSFERMMDRLKISRADRVYQEKIGNTSPATASITIDGVITNISFIRHSSAYFSPAKWQPFLQQQHEIIIQELKAKIL